MHVSLPQHSLPVPSLRLGSLLLLLPLLPLLPLPPPCAVGEQKAQRTPTCTPAQCSKASGYLSLLGIVQIVTKRSLGGGAWGVSSSRASQAGSCVTNIHTSHLHRLLTQCVAAFRS
jgi:hypothetical protein